MDENLKERIERNKDVLKKYIWDLKFRIDLRRDECLEHGATKDEVVDLIKVAVDELSEVIDALKVNLEA